MKDITSEEIIAKVEAAGLIGRGGAGYPTGKKWRQMFNRHHQLLYIAVNGSEGEPGTLKDGYILENHLEQLLEGIAYAYKVFPQAAKIYLYLRHDYFEKYKGRVAAAMKKFRMPLEVFREPGGYLCGENTVLCNAVEGKRLEPRTKPPYCSEEGIYAKPTLVNNLETFYRVGQIVNGTYAGNRFYSITGEAVKPGVYDLPVKATLAEVLEQTGNKTEDKSFVQVGGGASGRYYVGEELAATPADRGTGAIIIYRSDKVNYLDLLSTKLDFLLKENCGKCTPCREGLFRMKEMVMSGKLNEPVFEGIVFALINSSFCGLGEGAGDSFSTLMEKKGKIWG